MKESLQEIIRALKEVSPLLWETADKQAHVDAMFNIIYASISLFFVFFFIVTFKYCYIDTLPSL